MVATITVALLLYGQARFIEYPTVYESHKKMILDKYTTDVYIHTWFDSKNCSYDWYKWDKVTKEGKVMKFKCPNDTIELLTERYKPVSLTYSAPKVFKLPTYVYESKSLNYSRSGFGLLNEHTASTIISQLYTVNEVRKHFEKIVKETKKQYDFIIVTRPDIILDSFTDLYKLDKKYFYTALIHPYFPDVILIFNQSYIRSMNAYENLPIIYDQIVSYNGTHNDRFQGLFVPEILKFHNYLLYHPKENVRGLREIGTTVYRGPGSERKPKQSSVYKFISNIKLPKSLW